MAVSHFYRSVNLYRNDGSYTEIQCEDEASAANLAHEISDFLAEMIIRLQDEEANEPVPADTRIPYKVRTAIFRVSERPAGRAV